MCIRDRDYYAQPAYFEQEAAGSSKTALQDFWDDFPSLDNGEVRRTLAKCGLTTEHIESCLLYTSRCV